MTSASNSPVITEDTWNIQTESDGCISRNRLCSPVSLPISSEQIQSQLQEIVSKSLLPKAYVPVSTIPLTDTGVVDETTLASLEVIDSDLIRSIEEQLQSLPEIDRVAVVVEPLVKSIPLYI